MAIAVRARVALGATDPAERRRTLDLLGFEKQLVFATFSIGQFAFSRDPRGDYGLVRGGDPNGYVTVK